MSCDPKLEVESFKIWKNLFLKFFIEKLFFPEVFRTFDSKVAHETLSEGKCFEAENIDVVCPSKNRL